MTGGVTDSGSMLESAKYVAQTFLDDSHYGKVHQSLSSSWNRLHSLSAAIKLMEGYGVSLSPEEEQRLADMDESQQINAMVMKMPQQSNEQFQHFFLQLQLLVSTATRVRRALEDGRPDLVQEALEDAESTGISSYILRMAIVQAGSEVNTLRSQYEAWIRDCDGKMGKLIRGQEDAVSAQKKLAAAQAQLSLYTGNQNEKAKKVIMNFAAQSSKGLMSSSFNGWASYCRATRVENEIRKDYADRLDLATKRLVDYKATQLKNVRGVMEKKANGLSGDLLAEVWKSWHGEVAESKDNANNATAVAELEAKLKGMQGNQKDKSKAVMMRMNAGNDYALMQAVFKAFVDFHTEYQKDKAMEDAVKAAEKQIQEFLKTQSEGAKKVLSSMSGATESGLIQTVFQGWKEVWDEAKKEAEMEELLAQNAQKMSQFGDRNKANGRALGNRSSQQQDISVLITLFYYWRLDSVMCSNHRGNQTKVDSKRQQLLQVQQMFRNFAGQLEAQLKGSSEVDSARGMHYKRTNKNASSCSLPEISSGRAPKA